MKRTINLGSSLLLLTAMFCLAVNAPAAFGQGEKTKVAEGNDKKAEAKEDKAKDDASKEGDAEKEKADEPLYKVPDGTAEELFKFINKVKQTRTKASNREEAIANMVLKIDAVVEACEKIRKSDAGDKLEIRAITEQMMALNALSRYEPKAVARLEKLMNDLEMDDRPVIVNMLKTEKLKKKAASVPNMSDKERDAFIEELFASVDESGIDSGTYSMISGIGRTLGRTEAEAAAKLYERLAEAMKESDDPQLAERADRTLGSARRLRLPGNFMEINGKTAEGEDFDWAAYRGKVVLVDFWASWCGPCRAEIPNMKEQLENYGDKGFAIVGVNLDNTKKAYQKYVDDQELTWTNLMSDKKEEMGWNNPVSTYYGVSGIPTAILVDKEGKVITLSARGEKLNEHLEKLLGPIEEDSDGDSEEKETNSEKKESEEKKPDGEKDSADEKK